MRNGESEMLAHTSAHTRAVMNHSDTLAAQHAGRPDAGQLQELRRLERPRGQNHFSTAPVRDSRAVAISQYSNRPTALEHDLRDPRVGHDADIRSPARGVEKSSRRTLAATVPDVVLVISAALAIAYV